MQVLGHNDYYKAYDDRYKKVYKEKMLWTSRINTREVEQVILEKKISCNNSILEVGCGEGRDAIYLLNQGYNVTALEYSISAICKCNELSNNKYVDKFIQFDLLNDILDSKYDFIYSIAVLHMFVLDEHRKKFWLFVKEHLQKDAFALICVMGDGKTKYCSDISKSFIEVKRTVQNVDKDILVASTSCRIVDWKILAKEIISSGLVINKKWISNDIPEFDSSMCVLVSNN